MANLATAPFVAACAVLVAAALMKLHDPGSTRRAALAIGLPASAGAIRAFAVIELAVAGAGLVLGRAACLVVAALYGVLALVAFLLARRAPRTPCGCIGAASQPATSGHVALNAVAAAAAIVAATQPAVLARVAAAPAAGVVLVALSLCCARLAVLTVDLFSIDSPEVIS